MTLRVFIQDEMPPMEFTGKVNLVQLKLLAYGIEEQWRTFTTEFRLVKCNYSGFILPILCDNYKLIHTFLQNIALGEKSNFKYCILS